ncbi:MAG TPA: metal-dependent hydrolase [Solirubrobacteraceae bacterium]|nr:metal-dependent hydrolase [Solirubrobacteraceae bacterium]
MTGRSHMALGATSGLVATALAAPTHGPSQLAITTAIAAGAALICDLDTPNSLLANSLGPLTRLAARGLGHACGGHRHGTHSLLFCGLAGLAVTIALRSSTPIRVLGHPFTSGQAAIAAVTYTTTALALAALAHIHGLRCALLAAVAAAAAVSASSATPAIVIAFSAGCWSHLIGDALTPEGISLLWPASDRRVSLAVIGRTGDLRERAITAGLILCVAVLASNTLAPRAVRTRHEAANAPRQTQPGH